MHLERHGYSPTTLADYRSVVKSYLEPTIGKMPITEIRPALLDKFYRYLAEERHLAPATIRKVHALIRGSLSTAVKWGWLTTNAGRDATPPVIPKTEITLPSTDQVAAVIELAEAQDPTLGMFIQLAAATGARRGELCAVRWHNIDVVAGTVEIRASVYKVRGEAVGVKDTKNHSQRLVSLDPTTMQRLGAHRRRGDELARACGLAGVAVEGFVFSDDPDGAHPWLPDRVSHAWDRLRDQAGLAGVRLHDLRHFQATMLLQAGVPVSNVSKRIGHRNTATTLNVYAQALAEVDRESADVMGKLIDSGRSRRHIPPATP